MTGDAAAGRRKHFPWRDENHVARARIPRETRSRAHLPDQIRSFRVWALEAVTLAVLEREGHRELGGRAAAYRDAAGEAHGFFLARDRERRLRLTRELAYGRQRLLEIALPRSQRVEGATARERRRRSQGRERGPLRAISGSPPSLTVSSIEHDMNVVFRFASRIIVMVGAGSSSREAPGRSPAIPRCGPFLSRQGRYG